jgi:hypothetical protein
MLPPQFRSCTHLSHPDSVGKTQFRAGILGFVLCAHNCSRMLRFHNRIIRPAQLLAFRDKLNLKRQSAQIGNVRKWYCADTSRLARATGRGFGTGN